MTVDEALEAADIHEAHGPHMHSEQVGVVLAAEVRRLRIVIKGVLARPCLHGREFQALETKYERLEKAARAVDDMATRYGGGDDTIDLSDLQQTINALRSAFGEAQ